MLPEHEAVQSVSSPGRVGGGSNSGLRPVPDASPRHMVTLHFPGRQAHFLDHNPAPRAQILPLKENDGHYPAVAQLNQ